MGKEGMITKKQTVPVGNVYHFDMYLNLIRATPVRAQRR